MKPFLTKFIDHSLQSKFSSLMMPLKKIICLQRTSLVVPPLNPKAGNKVFLCLISPKFDEYVVIRSNE